VSGLQEFTTVLIYIMHCRIGLISFHRLIQLSLRSDHGPHSNGRNILVAKAVPVVPISFTNMQVAVHTAHEQCLTPQTNGCGSYISMDEKTQGLAIDPKNDIESGSGK